MFTNQLIDMATKKNGPLGTLVGKTGGYVSYYRMGQLVTRSIGVVDHWSDAQKAVQMGTALVTSLLKSMNSFIKVGFKNTIKPQTWTYYTMATSINKLGAIAGVFPELSINLEKVILAMGSIPPPVNAAVRLVNNTIVFNWDADLGTDGTDVSDQVVCMAYFPEINSSIIAIGGAKRGVQEHVLVLTSMIETPIIETYMYYVSDDRTQVSNSIYTGQLVWHNQ